MMHSVNTPTLKASKPAPTTSESVELPATLADLEHWSSTAEAGSTVAYFRGFLAMDRGPGSRLGEDAGEELDRVATAVMAMAEAGDVHLLQRRHGACDYTYLAVMSRTGVRRRVGAPGRESAS